MFISCFSLSVDRLEQLNSQHRGYTTKCPSSLPEGHLLAHVQKNHLFQPSSACIAALFQKSCVFYPVSMETQQKFSVFTSHQPTSKLFWRLFLHTCLFQDIFLLLMCSRIALILEAESLFCRLLPLCVSEWWIWQSLFTTKPTYFCNVNMKRIGSSIFYWTAEENVIFQGTCSLGIN